MYLSIKAPCLTSMSLAMRRKASTTSCARVWFAFVQPALISPTFITDFPLETSPLAKKRPDDPRLVRRFEGYLACQELVNAFSEINDPLDQRANP